MNKIIRQLLRRRGYAPISETDDSLCCCFGWLGAILLWYGLPLLGGLLVLELPAYAVVKSKKADK